MKKYLPFILVGLGILAVVAGFFIFKNKKASNDTGNADDEAVLADIPADKRPLVSLTPSGDGHYLQLRVQKIIIDADSFDYLLEYTTANGLLQGVPGIAKPDSNKSFQTDLLLGTESSGKFRYDEGVEKGSIELKFRKNGKLVAKFKSEFHMQTNASELSSIDQKFTYKPDTSKKGVFYVTMPIIGNPEAGFKSVTSQNGYGIFSSEDFVKSQSVSPTGSDSSMPD